MPQAVGTRKESAFSQTGEDSASPVTYLCLATTSQSLKRKGVLSLVLEALSQHHGALEDRLSLLGGSRSSFWRDTADAIPFLGGREWE